MSGEVDAWLKELTLEQYSAQFSENDISWDLLPELDHDTLKEIGVSSVGHRMRLIKAAVSFRPPSDEPVSEPVPEPFSASNAQIEKAERRQLTVMFCDLVDSTTLSARLDPEDLREIVRSYQESAGNVIGQFEGHIAQYLGDGLLVYFGYPMAHEDDARRAVLASLGIPRALAILNKRLQREYQVQLSVRIGIHTGSVVVGQMGGEGRQENLALGETPNLAARLQGLAEPDAVLLSGTTQELLGERFNLTELGLHTLKGIANPVEVFAVQGERQITSHFTAAQGDALDAIVGREAEVKTLMQRWQRASTGDGQMVLLTGEAGIGKSRIIRGLTDELADQQYYQITYQCSPYHVGTALYPAFHQLELAAGFAPDDSDVVKLDKLETVLEHGQKDTSVAAPLLALLMGLGEVAESRYGPLNLSPQQQRAEALKVLLRQLFGLNEQLPVLCLIEDVHWIDPTTLELTQLILESIGTQRILLVMTARPEFNADQLPEHPNLTRIELNRLGRDQIEQITRRVAKGKKLPPVLIDLIAAHADGVPLFVEELTKTMIASNQLRETKDAYQVSGEIYHFSVPTTLRDSLMARLDRMQSIKVVAQTAACIGREFAFNLLHAILPMGKNELLAALEGLVHGELISPVVGSAGTMYSFQHALVRDAAYESQLNARRQEVHQAVLEQLEADHESSAEVMAHHAQFAGQIEKAISYWQSAGDYALTQPAYIEASGHYERAIKMVRGLPRTDANKELELDLLMKLGQALSAGRGLSHSSVAEVFEQASQLVESLGNSPHKLRVTVSMVSIHIGNSHPDRALPLVEDLCQQAEASGNAEQLSIGYRSRGFVHCIMGRHLMAEADFKLAVDFYDPEVDLESSKRNGFHNGISIKCGQAMTFMCRGFVGKAWHLLHDVDKIARELQLPASLGFALSNMASMQMMAGRPEREQFTRDALVVTDEFSLLGWKGSLMSVLGVILHEEGRFEEAVECLAEGVALRYGAGGQVAISMYRAAQMSSLIACNRLEEAAALRRDIVAHLETDTEQWANSEVCRLLSLSDYRINGDLEAAISGLRRASTIADEQHADFWKLRVVLSLAELCQDNGRIEQARTALTQVLEAFPEDGRGLPNYGRAVEMLQQLRT